MVRRSLARVDGLSPSCGVGEGTGGGESFLLGGWSAAGVLLVGQPCWAGDLIDCTKMGIGGKSIPPHFDRVTDIKGDAKFVLLVEKEAAFMRLSEDRFYNTYPCIVVTGKGQPDVATRMFVKKLKEVRPVRQASWYAQPGTQDTSARSCGL